MRRGGWDTINTKANGYCGSPCTMIAIEVSLIKTSPMGAIHRRPLTQFLSCAAKAVGLDGEVSVLLTGDDRIRALNRAFRGKNRATDVLSFPAAPPFFEGGHVGDLAISLETALRQAAERGHTLQMEVKILMLHGLLHLAGFDHERDSGEMARREVRLRKQLALPPGLIERENQGAAPKLVKQKAGRPPAAKLNTAKSRRSEHLESNRKSDRRPKTESNHASKGSRR